MKLLINITISYLFFALSFCQFVSAQIVIVPLHQNAEFLAFDNLYQVNLINSTGINIEGFLEITVEDRNSRQSVLKLNSPLLNLAPGITNSSQINWSNNVDFGTSQLVNSLTSTGRFGSGDYVFCYNFISKQGGQYLGVNCQERPIKIAGTPVLISPYDGEVIETRNPVLNWRPPLPSFSSNVDYSLIIAPYFEGQSKIEAMKTNFSIVNQQRLNQPFQVYPFDAPLLEKGKKYVWQVVAFINGIELGATEIWEFKYDFNTDTEDNLSNENFHFVNSYQDASYYVANNKIEMAYKNRSNEKKLNYKIYAIDNKDRKINNLPEIELESGTNKIVINGDDLEGLEHMQKYTIVIKSNERKKFYFNFVYINK